jgi:hypothetical protein
MRAFIAASALLGLLAACSPLAADTKTRIADLERIFPLGSSLEGTEVALKAEHLPYTVFSPQDCEKNAKLTMPTYTPKGGPCAFALAKISQTWYGYSIDVQLRLFFDSSNTLVHRDFDRIDTFI